MFLLCVCVCKVVFLFLIGKKWIYQYLKRNKTSTECDQTFYFIILLIISSFVSSSSLNFLYVADSIFYLFLFLCSFPEYFLNSIFQFFLLDSLIFDISVVLLLRDLPVFNALFL